MIIEGTTKIELTDIHTGKKEVIEKKNMVTNALKYIFGINVYGSYNFEESMIPLYKRGIGGILCFDKNIEEDPDNYIPPGDIECVAHASVDAYAASYNERRGSMNLTETKLLDDGFKLVWDFANTQGNGTIRSVCLTSYYGGKRGLGHETALEPDTSIYNGINISSTAAGKLSIEFVYDEEYAWKITQYSNAAKIKVGKFKNVLNEINLLKSYVNGPQLISETDLDVTNKILSSEYKYTRVDTDYIYYSMFASSTKKLSIAIINKEDLSKREVEIDLAQYSTNFSSYLSGLFFNKGFAYIQDSKYKIIKINLDNIADVEIIGEGMVNSNMSYIYNNRIWCKGGELIDLNGKVLLDGSRSNYSSEYNIMNVYKNLYFLQQQSYSLGLYINPYYLATINNISPVIKTADKTMKITYIVRQLPDEPQ